MLIFIPASCDTLNEVELKLKHVYLDKLWNPKKLHLRYQSLKARKERKGKQDGIRRLIWPPAHQLICIRSTHLKTQLVYRVMSFEKSNTDLQITLIGAY